MAIVASLFVGCGGTTLASSSSAPAASAASESKAVSSTAPASQQTTIKLALWDYETVGYDKVIVESFEAAHPEYKVEVISTPNADYDQKITTMLTGGDGIDVFYGKSGV